MHFNNYLCRHTHIGAYMTSIVSIWWWFISIYMYNRKRWTRTSVVPYRYKSDRGTTNRISFRHLPAKAWNQPIEQLPAFSQFKTPNHRQKPHSSLWLQSEWFIIATRLRYLDTDMNVFMYKTTSLLVPLNCGLFTQSYLTIWSKMNLIFYQKLACFNDASRMLIKRK